MAATLVLFERMNDPIALNSSTSATPNSLSDPNDFPKSWKALQSFDSTLRCPVCGDFYSAPMGLPCGHQFCSFCIRNLFASGKEECPQCRVAATSLQLKPVRILEEIVAQFKQLRPRLLELVSDERVANQNLQSPGRKRSRSPSPKAPELKTFQLQSTPVESVKQTVRAGPLSRDLVTCPICQHLVLYKKLNAHLDDNCSPSTRADNESSSSLLSAEKGVETAQPRYLPSTAYFLMGDKELKRMLKDAGLPVTGTVSAMQKRHQQYVLLHNANVDRAKPKPASAIVNDVLRWEKNLDSANSGKSSSSVASYFASANNQSVASNAVLELDDNDTAIRKYEADKQRPDTQPRAQLIFRGPGNVKEDTLLSEIERSTSEYVSQKQSQFEQLIDQVKRRKKFNM